MCGLKMRRFILITNCQIVGGSGNYSKLIQNHSRSGIYVQDCEDLPVNSPEQIQ